MIGGLRAATSFLTRLPVGGPVDGRAVGRSLPWFPLVGAAVGLAVAGVYVGARHAWPALLAATLGLAAGVGATGAFHEDGFADFADGLGARDRGSIRRAMRDPRLGTYGVIALALGTLARVGAIAALAPVPALLWLPAAHAASRATALGLLAVFPPAPGDGLGSGVAVRAGRARPGAAVLVGTAIGVVALGWWGLVAAGVAAAVSLGVGRVARHRLGGLTGDVLGTAQQVGEIGILLLGAGIAGSWTLPPWWP